MISNLVRKLLVCIGSINSTSPNNQESASQPSIIDIAPSKWSDIPSCISDMLSDEEYEDKHKLYRSVRTCRLKHILKYGTDRDCTSELYELRRSGLSPEDIIWGVTNPQEFKQGPLRSGEIKHNIWLIAVYNLDKLQLIPPQPTSIPPLGKGGYQRNGEGPMAIIKIHINEQMMGNIDYEL